MKTVVFSLVMTCYGVAGAEAGRVGHSTAETSKSASDAPVVGVPGHRRHRGGAQEWIGRRGSAPATSSVGILSSSFLINADRRSPKGASENAWRYQFYNGRWWYWTPHDQWAFYDGRRWVGLSNAPREAMAGDHALRATPAPASGRVPVRTYSNFGGSPFYGPSGQAPQGHQPVAPAARTGGISPTPGSAGGVSELGISGSRSGDAGSGVGGGTVGGASVTGGLGQPTRP